MTLIEDLVTLTRLALESSTDDVRVYARRLSQRYAADYPEEIDALRKILRGQNRDGQVIREAPGRTPVDVDSKLELLDIKMRSLDRDSLLLNEPTAELIDQLIQERRDPNALIDAGLAPTRTALFVGPPGVGKTLSAQWIASSLDVPLMTVNLASLMSSYLGRSGSNLKQVLDYARGTRGVLFLDEIDAVAKRRGDADDVGELKRLVNVLLQEVDSWPDGTLLLAATNHPDLLDPAAWRRFEMIVDFGLPNDEQIASHIANVLGKYAPDSDGIRMLQTAFHGASLSEVERDVRGVLRRSLIQRGSVSDALWALAERRIRDLPRKERIDRAAELVDRGMTQRSVQKLTGTSRDTLRGRVKD